MIRDLRQYTQTNLANLFSTPTLIKGALKIMAWTKAKTAIVAGVAVILATGVTTSIIVHAVHRKQAMTSKAELTEAGNGAYGLYIHYGIATFANPDEKGAIPASRFAPASLDVRSWAHAAKKADMTFAVLTAKHESGFCLWDSQDYSYDVGGSPFKGDIIGGFHRRLQSRGHCARRALFDPRRVQRRHDSLQGRGFAGLLRNHQKARHRIALVIS